MEEGKKLEKVDQLNMMDLYPDTPFAKLMFKLPINLWRLGLGPLTGKLFLVVTTTGRKTGLSRRTMVEYYKMDGKKYAPCAFGGRANWYQNILADPHVTVQSADGTERMKAVRVTDDEELLAIIDAEMHFNPVLMKWYLNSLEIDPEDSDEILANKDRIIFMRFDPVEAVTPPGLEVDLAWIWPVLLILTILGRGRRRKK